MTNALPNSGALLLSDGESQLFGARRTRVVVEALRVGVVLSVLVALAAAWLLHHDSLLYYGDAQAHLNISRSLVDSRTPGYEELGNVWLPLLHAICVPFVTADRLWSTGLAGALPVASCFILAGTFLYLAARVVYRSEPAAVVVVSCFALNPNVLYLAAIPMTEMVFFAGLTLFLLCFACFRVKPHAGWIAAGIVASWAMSLSRYDGWFLIPFCAIWLAAVAPKRRRVVFLCFMLFASCAPLYWVAHNWYETGNALDFFNGPFSAKAIQGDRPYPGFHDWRSALLYYAKAGQLCSGWSLCLLAVPGIIVNLRSGTMGATGFLCLTPVFYLWSIHSSGNPIFVPQLYPYGYYNTRYGLAMVVLAAFACGALPASLPGSRRRLAALGIPLLAVLPWLISFSPEAWICWKESERNSVERRAWTNAAANFLRQHYQPGEGILSELGDVTGIYCRAGIPLRETLTIQNGAAWLVASVRPDLFHPEAWAVAQRGGDLFKTLNQNPARPYELVYEIKTPKAPDLEIYRRLP